jgi:hypothetical protein
MAPQTTKNQISKGAAPRAAARQKAHVQESADKLADLKARQAGEQPASEAAASSAPSPPAEPPSGDPTVQFVVDGKPVGATQNRLSSISRVTATKDAPRWPAEQFRAWLAEQGVADPNHTTWEVTLPNGRTIAAVAKGSAAARRKASSKKAPAKKAAAPRKPAAEVAKAS